jgi:hypothetical protein
MATEEDAAEITEGEKEMEITERKQEMNKKRHVHVKGIRNIEAKKFRATSFVSSYNLASFKGLVTGTISTIPRFLPTRS